MAQLEDVEVLCHFKSGPLKTNGASSSTCECFDIYDSILQLRCDRWKRSITLSAQNNASVGWFTNDLHRK